MADTITLAEARRQDLPMTWTAPAGIIHAVTGDYHHSDAVLWTLCLRDVPPGAADAGSGAVVDCPACIEATQRFPERIEGLVAPPFSPPGWQGPTGDNH